MRSLGDPTANTTVDLNENVEEWNDRDFSPSLKECLVCCENYIQGAQVVRMPCNPEKHFFHKKCIEVWFKGSENCPLCRETVTKVDTELVPADPEDRRSTVEREEDEAFERLLAGPLGTIQRQSIERRSVSLISLDADPER